MASYLIPKSSIHTKLLIFCPNLPCSFITSAVFPHQSDSIQVFPLCGPTAEVHPLLPHQTIDSFMEGTLLHHRYTVSMTGNAGDARRLSEGLPAEAGAAFSTATCKPILLNPRRDQTQGLEPTRQAPTTEPHTPRPETSFVICLESGTQTVALACLGLATSPKLALNVCA